MCIVFALRRWTALALALDAGALCSLGFSPLGLHLPILHTLSPCSLTRGCADRNSSQLSWNLQFGARNRGRDFAFWSFCGFQSRCVGFD
ncbi:hypothetical protein KC19_3G122200 [Ceratodon purpureus]|uniref:Secreted protein n=1 Tax=Ceratodon purpureus TaxID=3225 RepID=A0A8T0IK93_CERPU|nr:hypothetical protein KC19_3G122200 [Ceratodon purpureus]